MSYFFNLFRHKKKIEETNQKGTLRLHPGYFSEIPFEDIEKVGDKSLLYSNTFQVDWILGAFCNYQCSYCWPGVHSSKPDYRPVEILIKTADEIKRQARERGYNSFIFAFSGGEPSMSKGYLDLLRHLSEDSANCDNQMVHMTTNLSAGFRWLEKWIEATASLQMRHISASFHSEFAEKEVFADKIQFLWDKSIPVSINMVMVPERFEALWKDALYFHSRNININLIPQRGGNGHDLVSGWTDSMKKRLKEGFPNRNRHNAPSLYMDEYSEERDFENRVSFTSDDYGIELMDSKGKIYFLDRAERLNILNFNKFKGWECLAGYRSLIIDKKGYVKRGHSCSAEILGHIEEGFKLFPKVKVCVTKDACSCGRDLMIPKRKQNSSLPL